MLVGPCCFHNPIFHFIYVIPLNRTKWSTVAMNKIPIDDCPRFIGHSEYSFATLNYRMVKKKPGSWCHGSLHVLNVLVPELFHLADVAKIADVVSQGVEILEQLSWVLGKVQQLPTNGNEWLIWTLYGYIMDLSMGLSGFNMVCCGFTCHLFGKYM